MTPTSKKITTTFLTSKWSRIKEEVLRERNYICEGCEAAPATEAHHVLVGRKQGHPELDDKRNMMILCDACHDSGKWSLWENRVRFWKRQVERYGIKAMLAWIESVDLRDRPRYDRYFW